MKADVRRYVQDCEHCENEKGKRRLAHGMFSGHTTTQSRFRYSMEFQGQGQALTDETEALAIMDSFTKLSRPSLPQTGPHPRLLDEIFFHRGAPEIRHCDDAQEFMSELLTHLLLAIGTTRTTTCGHNAQSNGEIESWWRHWNCAMKFLSFSGLRTMAVFCPTNLLCLQLRPT
jgi:hypothetical protein